MNEIELRHFGHTMDAAWLMALLKAIYGGDPPPNEAVTGENATTNLLALALVSHMRDQFPSVDQTPGASLAKLAKFGLPVSAHLRDGKTFELDGPVALKHFALSAHGSVVKEGGSQTVCIRLGSETVCWTVFTPWR